MIFQFSPVYRTVKFRFGKIFIDLSFSFFFFITTFFFPLMVFSTLRYLRKIASIYLFRYLLDATPYYASLFLRAIFLLT